MPLPDKINSSPPKASITTYSANNPIAFLDLATPQALIRKNIETAIIKVLDHGQYLMGPEIDHLESALADFVGCRHAVTTSSGTDALTIGLMALGIKAGQGVIVPGFTFAATAEVLPYLGAVPIFAEVDALSFNLDPHRLDDALQAARDANIEVVGIIPVDLFGQPAAADAITAFADKHGLWVMADAAQSFGATFGGRRVGSLAQISITSFYPTKPLGCYGDGGALFTNDDHIAATARSLRVHGMSETRYEYDLIGMTGRMDTIQAAILLQKLTLFSEELLHRQQIAARYTEGLSSAITPPRLIPHTTSSWAHYCVLLPEELDREAVQDQLKAQGIPTRVYYSKSVHKHQPYQGYPVACGELEVTATLCRRILALPFHPYLEDDACDHVINCLNAMVS